VLKLKWLEQWIGRHVQLLTCHGVAALRVSICGIGHACQVSAGRQKKQNPPRD
jgi:hypothetical protein